MEGKSEIRAKMRKMRKAVSAAERAATSREICAKLLEMELGDVVAVYLASADEIDLTSFIEAALKRGTRLVAPRWTGETYELAELRGLSPSDLRPGPHGILEPVLPNKVEAVSHRFRTKFNPPLPTSWLVPGLAFTRDGRRLGYGGGWYDRLMADAPASAKKVGVAYSFQVVEDLPSEPHDILLTDVICNVAKLGERRQPIEVASAC